MISFDRHQRIVAKIRDRVPDKRIAREEHCAKETVRAIRVRLGLPPVRQERSKLIKKARADAVAIRPDPGVKNPDEVFARRMGERVYPDQEIGWAVRPVFVPFNWSHQPREIA